MYPKQPGYEHTQEGLRRAITDSLSALKVKKVDILYLHAPDRSVPFVDTCKGMNELHKEGKEGSEKRGEGERQGDGGSKETLFMFVLFRTLR